MSNQLSSRPTRVSDGTGSASPGAGWKNTMNLSYLQRVGGAALGALVLLCLLFAPSLHAQTTAQVTGTVTDSTGGVIPGATVTLINQATNTKRVTVTSSVGLYSFPAILPSTYTVEAVAKGFRAKQLTGIVVHGGESLSIPALALAVGTATQTVQVVAAPSIIPTDTGARLDVLDSKQIENLALQGQDATELLKVLPGATTQSGGLTQASPSFSDINISANESAIGSGININGVPNRGGTELLSDGVDVLDPGDEASSISMINPQMTQEITVQTSNFGAESQYGPVVVSAVSKSGGDHYHGEAYFDARNDVLNANDWQDNHQGIPRGDAHYYYPGGDFGGPVPGTHKTLFFWGGYERFLQNQGNANVLKSYIPTPEMLQGDFSTDNADNQALCPDGFFPNPNGKSRQQGAWCQDLSTTALPNGAVLPSLPVTNAEGGDNGQSIPSQFLDPGTKVLSSFWPKANANPTITPGGYNYVEPVDNINNGWIYRLRVDWDPNPSNKIYISYQQAYSAQLAQGNGAHIYWTPGNSIPFPGGGIFGKVFTKALAGHFIHTFGPTLTNNFVAAWGYGYFPFTTPNPSAAFKSTLGYPSGYSTVFNGGSKLIPSYSTAGNFTFPDFSQSDIFENPVGQYLVRKEVPSFTDTITKVWKSQTIKLGAYTQNTGNIQSNDGTNLNGSINSFNGQNPDLITGNLLGSPNPVANFDMGVVTSYAESNSAPVSDMAYQATAAFADDAWRVNSRLNLDFGARFEHVGHWYDRQGTGMAVFFPDLVRSDWESGFPDPGYRWHGIDPGIALSGQPNRLMFVSPRFGLAYDVFGNGNTVVRGGWGAYRFTGQYNDYAAALTTAQSVRNYGLPGGKTILLSQIGPSLLPKTCNSQCQSGGQTGLDATDYGEPLTYAYSLTVDQRLPWNSLLDVAYVGNSSSQIPDVSEGIEGSDFNALADQNKTPLGAFFKPDPVTGNPSSTNPENQTTNADGTSTGNSYADYHPFGYAYGTNSVVKIESSSYTNYNGLQVAWIKSAGQLTYDFNATWSKTLGTGLQENPYNINLNYGVEAIDRPFVFNSSYTYQTGHFNHGDSFVRGALSDWTISGISTWQAGGSIPALLGNGVPNFGYGIGYIKSTLPANAKDLGITSGIGTATYFGTDESGMAIMPVLTCNPNHGLAKYQRVNGKCFAAPALPALGGTGPGQQGGQNYPYISMGSYFDNDLALYKSFHIHDTQNIQFRISAFNWLNHPLPEFSSQNQVSLSYVADYNSRKITDTTPSTFGFMDTKSQAPYSRILELNVKYSF